MKSQVRCWSSNSGILENGRYSGTSRFVILAGRSPAVPRYTGAHEVPSGTPAVNIPPRLLVKWHLWIIRWCPISADRLAHLQLGVLHADRAKSHELLAIRGIAAVNRSLRGHVVGFAHDLFAVGPDNPRLSCAAASEQPQQRGRDREN